MYRVKKNQIFSLDIVISWGEAFFLVKKHIFPFWDKLEIQPNKIRSNLLVDFF